jgi:hypothetical protein
MVRTSLSRNSGVPARSQADAAVSNNFLRRSSMRDKTPDANRDPITGAPGAHPVGTGAGAAAGGMAGAAAGTAIGGPAGTVIGAAVGAVAGGLAGKGVAEMVDPTVEEAYWRENYTSRPYYSRDYTFDDYGPAYRYGLDNYSRYPGKSFDDVEGDLSRDWQRAKGKSRLAWENAKDATRDAWQRVSDTVERATPGDSDRDGK